MHRIIQAHLKSFSENFGYISIEESIQFEKFCTFSVFSSRYSADFDLDEVTTGENDDGVDGVAVVIDETPCPSPEEAEGIFREPRRNHDVDVVFVQAKGGERFDLGDFLKFKEGILRFITAENYTANDDVLIDAKAAFDVVISNVPKVRNGRPSIFSYFITTGVYQSPLELERARKEFEQQLLDLGYFNEVEVRILGRDELTKLWVGTYSGTQASLTALSNAALPEISGIDEAYLAVVKAADIVDRLLITEDGNLRGQVFEENVRAYLGDDNPVNKSISDTIKSTSASRFPVLNNGITIVSPDVQLQGSVFHLKNYQIVNGCQTSNVLFENREHLGEIMVNLKIVETQDEDVFADLVRATNSQSRVDDAQFLSLKPVVRRVEQYFNSIDTEDKEKKLFLERRDRQYVGQDIPAIRVYSLHNAAKCVASMYCGRPELAFRYPKQMYEELGGLIFADDVREIVFYSACLTMHRFNLLVSNSTIPQNMKKFKWHILAVVKAIVCGKTSNKLGSRDVEKEAAKIVSVMEKHGPEATSVFDKATKICVNLGEVTNDRLKRQAILTEMLENI
jgi:GTPase Era involved in 16S rRNA processing